LAALRGLRVACEGGCPGKGEPARGARASPSPTRVVVVPAAKLRYLWKVPLFASAKRRLREAMFDAVPGGRLLWRGPSTVKRVALTFDDGPDAMTVEYLDVLDRLGVPGTFFIMGDMSERRPDLVREYMRRGHQIAAHGYDHQNFVDLSGAQLDQQLVKTDAAIGPQPVGRPWVRPPYGAFDPRVLAHIASRGWAVALWSLDSEDYQSENPEAIVKRCDAAHVRPGEVILFHESHRSTLVALPRIVESLHSAGYECVTMADLFAA
jgi:peptidoglycan/xylan/chitin deacetylase (PgdA/CDA1 family)